MTPAPPRTSDPGYEPGSTTSTGDIHIPAPPPGAEQLRREDLCSCGCHSPGSRHLRSLLAEATSDLEHCVCVDGSGLENLRDNLLSRLRAVLAAPQPAELRMPSYEEFSPNPPEFTETDSQPAEPEEAELSLKEIARILGWMPNDIEKFKRGDWYATAEDYERNVEYHEERVSALRALARLLREREAATCPGCDKSVSAEPGRVIANGQTWHSVCYSNRVRDVVGKIAVSPSPPETAANLEKPKPHKHVVERDPDFLEDLDYYARESIPSNGTLAAENEHICECAASAVHRLRQVIRQLEPWATARVARLICPDCDGKAEGCQTCNETGRIRANLKPEDIP